MTSYLLFTARDLMYDMSFTCDFDMNKFEKVLLELKL